MKQALIIFATMLFFACAPAEQEIEAAKPDAKTPAIPEFRENPSTIPVANYRKPIANDLNGFVFAVKAFETKRTAVYKLDVQYKVLHVVDSFAVPVLSTLPRIVIQPDSSRPYGCFVGITDSLKGFLPMRHIYVQHEELKLKTIAKVAVRTSKQVAN